MRSMTEEAMAVLPVAREVLVQTVGDVRKGQFWQEAHKMFSAPRSSHVNVAAGPLCLCGGKSVQFFSILLMVQKFS